MKTIEILNLTTKQLKTSGIDQLENMLRSLQRAAKKKSANFTKKQIHNQTVAILKEYDKQVAAVLRNFDLTIFKGAK